MNNQYLALLRRRPQFRRIWLASVASLAGDWFTLIALYTLLLKFTGSGESVGLMLAARFLPAALFGPFAGVVADRLSRRRVMIACDVARAAIVGSFAFVETADQVWLVYLLTFAQMSVAAFFDPAEQAASASVVEPEELVTASTLQGVTWSAMLSVGAVLGGVVATVVGPRAAFAVDAASYLVSAALIASTQLPLVTQRPRGHSWVEWSGLGDLLEGLRFLRGHAGVRRALWVKAGWAIPGGAALLLYAMFGEQVFPLNGSGALGVGILLGMRGVGALLGPLVARRSGGDTVPQLERAIGFAYLVTVIFWALFAFAPNLAVAAACLAAAHTGISTQWVFSTSLIALQVDDRMRGRIFSIDFMAYLVLLGLSSWAGGRLVDGGHVPVRTLMAAMAGLLMVSGAVWWWLVRRSAPFRVS